MSIFNRHVLIAAVLLAGPLVGAWADTDAAPPTVTECHFKVLVGWVY